MFTPSFNLNLIAYRCPAQARSGVGLAVTHRVNPPLSPSVMVTVAF